MGSTEQTKTGNLIVEGVLRLGQFTTANAPSGTEGALYFNTTEKKTKIYSNAAWGDLGGGAEPGQLPTYTTAQRDALSPSAGLMIYNTDYDQVQTYTQTAWSGITGSKDLGIECASAMDCASGFCVDAVCCDTSTDNCTGCRRCNVSGSMGICIDDGLECTGNCDVCSSGNCIEDATLCTGNCDICTGSGTAYSCAMNNALCSNSGSSCYCSGSGTVFNCQSCSSSPYGDCGAGTCSDYTCGVVGVVADNSGQIFGDTVYCDEHDRLWTPTQSGTYNWDDAISLCSGLTYAGFTDWVVPNNGVPQQLAIDICGSCACVPTWWDSLAVAGTYWTTATWSDYAYICFYYCSAGYPDNTYPLLRTSLTYVRCVRGQ